MGERAYEIGRLIVRAAMWAQHEGFDRARFIEAAKTAWDYAAEARKDETQTSTEGGA